MSERTIGGEAGFGRREFLKRTAAVGAGLALVGSVRADDPPKSLTEEERAALLARGRELAPQIGPRYGPAE